MTFNFLVDIPSPGHPEGGAKMTRESLTVGYLRSSERPRVGSDIGSELPEGWGNFTQ